MNFHSAKKKNAGVAGYVKFFLMKQMGIQASYLVELFADRYTSCFVAKPAAFAAGSVVLLFDFFPAAAGRIYYELSLLFKAYLLCPLLPES